MMVVFANVAQWDCQAMIWVRGTRRPVVTLFLKGVTYSGTARAWAVASVLLWILSVKGVDVLPQQALFLGTMRIGFVAYVLGYLLKRIFGRTRPFDSIADFVPLVSAPHGDSFPSSHASTSVGLFVGLLLVAHPFAPLVGVWAILVSYSRFYLGVHFPSDILGGAVFGVLCALIAHPFF
ncbi:MAG: phosphatase PAP2 family protein [Bdellovibrionota bacterium]